MFPFSIFMLLSLSTSYTYWGICIVNEIWVLAFAFDEIVNAQVGVNLVVDEIKNDDIKSWWNKSWWNKSWWNKSWWN